MRHVYDGRGHHIHGHGDSWFRGVVPIDWLGGDIPPGPLESAVILCLEPAGRRRIGDG